MLESTKEDATGLPEGSDIGLGARCREFESPHSDQKFVIQTLPKKI